MKALISKFFDHNKAVLLVLFSIFFFGIMNYIKLPKEENPDVQIPMFYIPMNLQGISPEDAERLLVKPLEKKLRSIEGIDEILSVSYEGGASITLKFESSVNMKQVINDVRAKVQDTKPFLPQELREIFVQEINVSEFPVLNVILKGDVSERDFISTAKYLRDRIEIIPEVLSVNISGARDEMIEINIEPSDLEIYKIDISEIERLIQLNNFMINSGSLRTSGGEFSLKVSGLFENIEQIKNLPIKVSENNAILRLKDIASVKEALKDHKTIARVNGEKAVVLEVSKRSGKNIIDTIKLVKDIVNLEKSNIPSGIEVIFSQDSSKKIDNMLKELISTIIVAIIIVFLVISYSLGLRSALLVSISIPGSFFIGIIIISLMNLTINVVVLFSLILAIGMLVDAAIVIVEYADRKMIHGFSPKDAYLTSASDMFWPCVAASLTTKIVFLPLLFWPGVVGKFMRYMPLTLLSTLIGSLFMALMFIPILGSYFGKPKKLNEEEIQKIEAIESGDPKHLNNFMKKYYDLLNISLKKPFKTILGILSILVFIGIMFFKFGKGIEFFPKIEPENVILEVHARGNLSIFEKSQIMSDIEKIIIPKFSSEVKVFYSKSGFVDNTLIGKDNIGRMFIEFKDWGHRRKANLIMNDIRFVIEKQIPGIYLSVLEQQKGPTQGKAIQFDLVGKDDKRLSIATDLILKYMSEIGGFIDIEDSKPLPMIDFELIVNREKAIENGIYISSMNALIPLLTDGVLIGKYRSDKYDEEIDINVRFFEEYRNLSKLNNLRINGSKGMVPISNFAKFVPKQKLSNIDHSNGSKIRKIQSNVLKGFVPNNLLREIIKYKDGDLSWPEDILLVPKGDTKDMKETSSFLGFAFFTALFGMVIILVFQFNSIFYGLLILTAVIFSTFGVFIALIIKSEPFGIVMCGLAIITLTGIVVNNNILLIDAYIKLRKSGMDYYNSVIFAAVSRIRPILLTSVTTAIGLLPMVFSLGINFIDFEFSIGAPSAGWWVQLSTAITGGVLFATLLTLFFTPSALILFNKYFNKN